MKQLYKRLSIIVFSTIISVAFTSSYAQQSIKIPAPIDWKAVSDWKLKVEAHPDSLSYHSGYIKSIGWDGNLFILERDYKSRYDSAEVMLDNQYRIWASMFPSIPAVHYAIGSAFYEHESPKATAYLKKVLELDAKNADEILEMMQRLNEEFGKTILIVTHDPKAANFARHQVHLEKGVLDKTVEVNR